METNTSARKAAMLRRMSEIACEMAPSPGLVETCAGTLFFSRRNEPTICQHSLADPLAFLTLQGRKLSNHGRGEMDLTPGTLMLNCVDAPSSSTIVEASPEKPYLAAGFLLDRKILAELLAEMKPEARQPAQRDEFALPAPLDFLGTILRLAEVSLKPSQAPILGPLILRELHFLLLIGPQRSLLRDLYMRGSKDGRIIDIIAWLKQNLDRSISVEALARKTHMSVSSLHRHFKSVTGFSPLQYHKELRLHEAQRLMLAENERADIAALAVGYESVTQFNREYKRKFGLPPHKDILRRKSNLP